MFPANKTLAIVGNASSVLESQLGEYIDSHDVVVRFNECAIDGFKDNIGERTDILVTNPYTENRKRLPSDGKNLRLIMVINPMTRRGDVADFSKWVGTNKILFSYVPDLVGVNNINHKAGLTTGTYGIQLLWRLLRPSRVFVTGFTMFLNDGPGHYWKSGRPSGEKSHDVLTEASIFINLLNSIKVPVEITSEIKWVSQVTEVPLLAHIKVPEI